MIYNKSDWKPNSIEFGFKKVQNWRRFVLTPDPKAKIQYSVLLPRFKNQILTLMAQ